MAIIHTFKALCFCIMVITFMAPLTLAVDFAGGTGEPNDPFQIATAEQLISIGSEPNLLDKHFVLVNDIDLDPNLPGGQVFSRAVIAPCFDTEGRLNDVIFTGNFDGNGHRIRNLIIHSGMEGGLGLFGVISKGRVHNLGLEDVSIIAANGLVNIGGLAGIINYSTINSCYVTGSIFGGKNSQCLGGLVGLVSFGTITNCYTTCSIYAGDGCKHLGGLMGSGMCWITNCYATGSVSGGNNSRWLGGLVGSGGSTLSNCYATGSVSGGDNSELLGGLSGQNWGYVGNCYFLTPSDGGGPDNGEGLPLADEQMKQQASFVS